MGQFKYEVSKSDNGKFLLHTSDSLTVYDTESDVKIALNKKFDEFNDNRMYDGYDYQDPLLDVGMLLI